MATVVIMPRQGQSVESCIIAKWHKRRGERVAPGDTLFTYETDKATFDEEAKIEGVLLEAFFEEGDDVACLSNVCVIGEPGEDVSAFVPDAARTEAEEPQLNAAVPAPQAGVEITQTAEQTGRLKISPRARALAERTGADAAYAVPSGAGGRVMERDIEKVVEQGKAVTAAARAEYIQGSDIAGTGIGGRVTTADLRTALPVVVEPAPVVEAPEYEELPVSGIRKVIADSMHTSIMSSAQLTLNASFDATDILEFRSRLKASAEKLSLPEGGSLPVVSLTDIIVYVTSRVLLRHKRLNAHYLDNKMNVYETVHMGVATDTPRGLIVPTVFGADRLTLTEISARAKVLIDMCRRGAISPDLITGGTFTVSNLGAFGVESFTPILNPPQTGLLGVCAIIERTKAGRTYPAMGLSLTFDHRALDGADAARFLKDMVTNLENFSLMAAMN